MRFIISAYAALFVAWAALEIRELRRSGYPWPALVAEILVVLFLFAGLFACSTGLPAALQPLWAVATAIVAGAAVALRFLAFENEEADLALSADNNRRAHVVALAVGLVLIAPAVYASARVAFPAGLSSSDALSLAAATLAGVVVARRVPRFRGVFQSEQERNLVEWLKHPLEFGRPPDEIAVLDARDRPWPDHDDEVSCALFRFRYGADWQVGIVGPFTFSKEFPQDATVEMIYDGFESFQVGTVRELVKRDLGDAS